ncbi:hypothetical protein [Amycolatopsis sp. 505]|uniref:hypothetical protein n=1 Tax=Amycolatopsis sp. 505 TaxID=2761538 RepID=UPI00287722F6|nr:hypothetical protein [Amycolatopsis sp. 505]MDS0134621.1 hypothetical protein [Amycolatopsis sp. 505]
MSRASPSREGHRHRVEPADRRGFVVDPQDRLVRGDPGVVRKGRADDDQEIGLVHQLDFIGQHQVRHAAAVDRVLDGERGRLGVVASAVDGGGRDGHVVEPGEQIRRPGPAMATHSAGRPVRFP